MAASDAATRVLIARIAANRRWAKASDRTAAAEAGQLGLRASIAREIDPDGKLHPKDLELRVDSALRAHMAELSLRSKQKRETARGA